MANYQYDRSYRNDRSESGYRSRNNRFGNGGHRSKRNGNRIRNRDSGDLIASDRVEGTAVYDHDRKPFGIDRKLHGSENAAVRVEYAVLSFGGFLGMNQRHYPHTLGPVGL